jgi:hypothetical protein
MDGWKMKIYSKTESKQTNHLYIMIGFNYYLNIETTSSDHFAIRTGNSPEIRYQQYQLSPQDLHRGR